MYGVVLWSDTEDQKAVIWCEDHGDLVFYRQPSDAQPVMLDAGDWIQFDITTDRRMRYAHNPRLVADGLYPELAEAMEETARAMPGSRGHAGRPAAMVQESRDSAEIIPFVPRRTECQPGWTSARLNGA